MLSYRRERSERRTLARRAAGATRGALFALLALSVILSAWGCGGDEREGAQVDGSGQARGGGPGASGFPDDVVRQLDEAVAGQMEQNELPGVVVGVWAPGEGEYVAAMGEADLETGEARDVDDPFRVGSITKTFVATAVLRLVEGGDLSRSDKLARWYPDFPNADRITVGHLLSMRSGIVDPDFDAFVGGRGSPEDAIDASARLGGAFLPPGQRTEYTNTNFVILGRIVEEVSGEDLGAHLDRTILGPLDLEDTAYPTNSDLPGDDLRGYAHDAATGELKDVTDLDPGKMAGAGAMVSNASDLRAWAKAVCTGALLGEETQRARMKTRHESGRPEFFGYGEGIAEIGPFCGHEGAVPGFSTEMWHLPEEDATIVVNVNRQDEFDPPPSGAVAEAVARIVFPEHTGQM